MYKNTLSPCAADALSGNRRLTVAGKRVGITGLDAAFAAVTARGLVGDAEIKAELMHRIPGEQLHPAGPCGRVRRSDAG